ncbi:topology modulation protein [uncultured Cohaesibacter sp.]|uniref:topology modulation protein n=1 Tax=uncultured Cohaesibacter sp. TaxID=1002546 RepID=UPI0029C8A5E2|nr:topology modulation protein [uncultured Cohaesibacter sp.]
MYHRIVILGCAGSGKSTLSRALSDKLGLPIVHLDRLYWNANWQMKDKSDFTQNVAEAINEECWIMDGNYLSTAPARLASADLTIFLDTPRWLCLTRVIKRTLIYYKRNRPDMPTGCNERFDWDFLTYVWSFNRTHRPRLMDVLKDHHGLLVTLKSPREARAFIKSLEGNS